MPWASLYRQLLRASRDFRPVFPIRSPIRIDLRSTVDYPALWRSHIRQLFRRKTAFSNATRRAVELRRLQELLRIMRHSPKQATLRAVQLAYAGKRRESGKGDDAAPQRKAGEPRPSIVKASLFNKPFLRVRPPPRSVGIMIHARRTKLLRRLERRSHDTARASDSLLEMRFLDGLKVPVTWKGLIKKEQELLKQEQMLWNQQEKAWRSHYQTYLERRNTPVSDALQKRVNRIREAIRKSKRTRRKKILAKESAPLKQA